MPARPRGLLEPCAATSGQHGSEEGGAGKRRPLSDNKIHWIRDAVWREDDQHAYAGTGAQVMATLRNLALSLRPPAMGSRSLFKVGQFWWSW